MSLLAPLPMQLVSTELVLDRNSKRRTQLGGQPFLAVSHYQPELCLL